MDAKQARSARLMPGGVPRNVRCYDNGGETVDRYTVVFTGRYRHRTGGVFWNVGMSAHPFHPQGFGMHGEHWQQIDYPTYSHLGRKIPFSTLPDDCRKLVKSDYVDLWNLG